MDFKLELVAVPVSDVYRAKAFYEGPGGVSTLDHDHTVSDEMRFVQLTPVGRRAPSRSAPESSTASPGSVAGLQLVVDDVHAARDELVGTRRRCERDPGLPLGLVHLLQPIPTATAGPSNRSPRAR